MANRSDTFDRSNSSSALGTPSDGGSAWVAAAGTWGINSNLGYCAVDGGGWNLAYLESSEADGTVSVVFSTASFAALLFRYTDASNHWRVFSAGGDLYVEKVVSGTPSNPLGSAASSAGGNGVTISVELSGSGIVVKSNGTTTHSGTDSDHATATKHGIGAYTNNATGVRFNNFSFSAPAGDTTPPTLSSASGTGGLGVCSGSVSTDEGNGTLYAVATASATQPSVAQIKAGQDHTGAAALRVVSQAVSGTGTQSIASGAISGGAGTRYWHMVHADSAANDSNRLSSSGFSVTAAATQLVVSAPDAASVTGVAGVVLSAAAPGTGVTVIKTISGASFDGSGSLAVDITGLGVATGAYRYVVLSKSDGTPGQSPAPFCAQGPVIAS